jgi:hypothetical protein
MRKYLIVVVAALVSALAIPTIAQADDIQSITGKLSPGKRDKKKFKPATIYVEILTQDLGEGATPNQPPSAYNTKVNFPKNAKFNPGAVKKCKVPSAQLENTTADQAIKACGKKSVVSVKSSMPTDPPGRNHATGTSAWVTVDFGVIVGQVPVQVTGFNGNKKDTLYLHSYAPSANNTSVLVGKLKTGKKAPKGYGSQLDVTVPPLLAGAISRFTTTVKNGKYVQARCKNKNEKWQAITTYNNYPTTTDDYKSTCKQKKNKKKK